MFDAFQKPEGKRRWRVEEGPHGVHIHVDAVARQTRVLLIASCLFAALGLGWWGSLDDMILPLTQARTDAETLPIVRDHWCMAGTVLAWPPEAQCMLDGGEILPQADWEEFRERLPPGPWRIADMSLHPWAAGCIVLFLACVVYRMSRPLDVRVRSNGIHVGDRFFHRDGLSACRIVRRLGLRVLVIDSRDGRWISPPLNLEHWQRARLLDEITALIPSPEEARAESEAKVVLDRELGTVKDFVAKVD